ncbi:Crp/Fnr family transcriptional regulator [Myroides pelagicus]|uniref:Cyclic nucleotide-binding domain-containing protein n=1 Tax=Myroides pelagicus TaxID=270914 RepID=A0A7K1GJW2_9FLAO|nr:Crp/Fnr family transcriptional regulator [Myroides pelagicus]MTH29098.1 cyclic nucleotide-binding domain-containing protein [Myroides pelagicus]
MESNIYVEQLLRDLSDKVVQRLVAKGEEILSLGEICDFVGIVRRGSLRMYYIDGEGNDVSFAFYLEGNIFTHYEGVLTNMPSQMIIVAMEDTEVELLPRPDLFSFYEESIENQALGRSMADLIFLEAKRRIDFLLFLSPEQRYLQLLSDTPQIFDLVAHKYIASYIGVKPQSLSRIRARLK